MKFLVLAYLDPGTGSFFLQWLLAGVLGILVSLKTFWKKPGRDGKK